LPEEVADPLWNGFKFNVPTQVRFLHSDAKYRLLSSGYGSGKSFVGCRETLRHVLAFPGSRHMVSRLHYPDLRDTTMVTWKKTLDQAGLVKGKHYEFNKNDWIYEFENESTVLLRNLDDEEKFGSLEVNTIFVDEGSEVPDSVYKVLFPSRLRWRLPSCQWDGPVEIDPHTLGQCRCPRRAWICTNPGASGYLRKVTQGEMGDDWQWFPVKAGENVNDIAYHQELAKMGERYGKVWFERYVSGSWDAFEGQRFTMFDREEHVVKPFVPDQSRYDIYEGWDFGYRNPTAVVWLAVDKNGEDPVVAFREYEYSERSIEQNSRSVLEIRKSMGLASGDIMAYGDPIGQVVDRSGLSDILLYYRNGIEIIPCTLGKDPNIRAHVIARLLSSRKKSRNGESPALVVTSECPLLADALIEYRYKEVQSQSGEDQPEKFLKQNDHLVDALGYGLAATPFFSPDPVSKDLSDFRKMANRHPTVEDADRQWQNANRPLTRADRQETTNLYGIEV